MGKESELWDDSALIDAMSKHKKMHAKKKSEANVSVDDAMKPWDAGENSRAGVIAGTETEEAMDLEPVKENRTPEPHTYSSTSLPMQDGYSDLQGSQDYNRLLGQYYEVEEKRLAILQQLQQYGNWGYQYSAEGSTTAAPFGTSCVSQECSIPTSQALRSAAICSCCPYVCQSLVAPCTSYPCCSLPGTSVGKTSTDPNGSASHGSLPKTVNTDIVKTVMGAAERAISSLTTKASINPNVNEEEKDKKDGEEEMNHGDCETDLAVLLNAWYSAGFHTGKYLAEQSNAKEKQ
ncbi:hypothetical protein GQ457_17G019910 [Hibiscus cannabinus]